MCPHLEDAVPKPDLPEARRALILQRLAAGQSVIAAELAAEFELSEDAIRRDLRALAAEGLCRRVYGGAVPIASADQPLAARLREAPNRKSALARVGVETIQAGELVFIDLGSTNLALVDFLPEDRDLTIATNSIDVAAAVLRRQDLRLLLVGGEVDRHVGGCVDAAAVESLRNMRIDRSFVGTCALSAEGLMTPQYVEATFKRTLVHSSRAVVALVTNDKVHAHAPHRVAELSSKWTIVLEHDVDEAVPPRLREAGVETLLAEATP